MPVRRRPALPDALRLCVFAACVAAVASCATSPPRPAPADAFPAAGRTAEVRILRDGFGVPHVYGRTDPDVAYGLAWAHAEDDFETLQVVIAASRGVLAHYRGPDAAPTDYLVHWLGVWDAVADGYARSLSADTRALVEAYAAGLNRYAERHPEEAWPGLFPVGGADVVAGFAFRIPFFYGLDAEIRALLEGGADPSTPAWRDPADPARLARGGPFGATAPFGSNAVAVAPSRSDDGATRLLVNSHQPFAGPVAWYEVRLHSEKGWDAAGGVFPGAPVMLHGHNRDLGWASTVNRPDLVDVYRLELHPDDPDRYRFGEGWRTLERDEARISVRLAGPLRWTVRREVLRSVHGPVLRTDHGTFAVRYAGMDEVRHLEQYYRMNRARSFSAWQDAMRLQALPSINFVYADREGNIAYFYNARAPKRLEGPDWRGVLPGDRPELVWTETLPFASLPRVVNPASGFVVNANHTPFRATADGENPDPADFPSTLGIETNLTNRALRALALFGGDRSITREEFRAYKLDKTYAEDSGWVAELEALLARDWGDDPELAGARPVLAAWDRTAGRHSRGAALALGTLAPLMQARFRGRPEPDPLDTLRSTARRLRAGFGRLDPPWSRVNRVRRGALDLAVAGGPDTLRAVDGRPEADGTITADSGDCFVLFVEWDAQGRVRSDSVHQFGTATTRPASPHYADQVPLYVSETTKPVLLEEAELRRHLASETRREPPDRVRRAALRGAAGKPKRSLCT